MRFERLLGCLEETDVSFNQRVKHEIDRRAPDGERRQSRHLSVAHGVEFRYPRREDEERKRHRTHDERDVFHSEAASVSLYTFLSVRFSPGVEFSVFGVFGSRFSSMHSRSILLARSEYKVVRLRSLRL